MMKRILLVLSLSLCALTGLQAQRTDSAQSADPYAEAVARLMAATNVRATILSSVEGMYVNMKSQMGLTEAQAKEMAGVVVESVYDRVVELYVPIYKKYYSIEELVQLCAFYDSPLGQKVARYSPAITREGMQQMDSVQPLAIEAVQRYVEKIR